MGNGTIADSEAAVVELLCAAPEDSIGFVSAAAYTIAEEECDAQAGLVAVQEDGLTWQMGMLVTAPGAADELADLDGRRWAVADTRSLPDYLYFRSQLAAAGIEPGEVIAAPEETSALLALTNDEADFTTAQYVPPIMPQGRAWVYGETEPEEWRLLGVTPSRSPIGYVIVGLSFIMLALIFEHLLTIRRSKLIPHGMAGDIAAKRVGKECLIASDIIDSLPEAFKNLEKFRE